MRHKNMKIQFVKSLGDLEGIGEYPIKEEDRGKASRVKIGEERTLMIILPCGHLATLNGWNITDIDTDTPSATPSIFCSPQLPCWHGYLTKGELIKV